MQLSVLARSSSAGPFCLRSTHMLNNPTINMATLRVACSNCNLRELCLPLGLTLKEIERLEELVSTRKRVRRGEALYRAGDRFDALYAWVS